MNSIKWKIGWGLSNKCNMACKFCYSRKVRREQKNFDNIIQTGVEFVKRNKDRIDSINFGTGEPTVELAFFRFCDQLNKVAPNVTLGVTTNGNLAKAVNDPYNMDVFIRCIKDVDVSLDFGNAEQQDESRNCEGAFQGVIETLKLCQKFGKNATVVSVMHKFNCSYSNFSSMIRIARLYNASFRINILRPTVDFAFALPYKNLKDNFINLIHEYEVESIADPLLAALVEADCPNGDPTAESSFRILPNGYVTPSTYLLDANWQAKRLDEIDDIDSMHELDSFKTIKSVEIPYSCEKCMMREKCKGGVFDRRWLWYHDFSENDPYCPLRFADSLGWKQMSGDVIYSKERKSFVHDGYLPTLIFSPRINKRALSQWDYIYLNYRSSYNSMDPDPCILKAEGMMSYKTERKVLDLGSGLGRNGKYFLSKGDLVSFVESSKIANDILVKELLDRDIMSGYSVIECDIVEFLEDEKGEIYDFILAMHIISHGTTDIIASSYLKNIHRVLKRNGIACITLPSINDRRCPDHNADIYEYVLEDGPEKGIVHSFYSETAVLRQMKGFEVLEICEITNTNGNAHWNLILRKINSNIACYFSQNYIDNLKVIL